MREYIQETASGELISRYYSHHSDMKLAIPKLWRGHEFDGMIVGESRRFAAGSYLIRIK